MGAGASFVPARLVTGGTASGAGAAIERIETLDTVRRREARPRWLSAVRASCARFTAEIQSRRVELHRGYLAQMLESFPHEYFGWVYIDDNHLYDLVKKDRELSFARTKRGGYISGDDYTAE
jgi:hypothetical protein